MHVCARLVTVKRWWCGGRYVGGRNDLDHSNLLSYWHRELDSDHDGVINDNEFTSVVGVALGHAPTDNELEEFRDCVAPQTVFTTAWVEVRTRSL